MNTNAKIAAIGLAAALVGGSAGATLTSWKSGPAVAETQPAPVVTTPAPAPIAAEPTAPTVEPLTADAQIEPDASEYAPAAPARPVDVASNRHAAEPTSAAAPATRSSRSTGSSAHSSSRQVNYDYGQPRASSAPSAYTYRNEPSFWNKHRDILTVGIGAGSGALLGGLFGGKKGAAIGTLAGAGGSALYTYKLRKRHSSY